jgi:hypothetical protein
MIFMTKLQFAELLLRAIRDYEGCTEDDERSDVVQALIYDLENGIQEEELEK